MSGQLEQRAAPRAAASGRVPDFLIVGHEKSGTTALWGMLKRHPQIFMPELKEPWFFAPELRSPFRRPGARPESLPEYLALFAAAGAGQIAGEASSCYLTSEGAAERIAAVAPAAKIVAIFREPAAFLRSLHMQCIRNHVESEPDLGRALELEPQRRIGQAIPPDSPRPQALLYSDYVRYTEQLKRFHACFPPENVCCLIYEDFRADNAGTLRRLLGFLGVDPDVQLQAHRAAEARRVRSVRLHRLVDAIEVGRGPLARRLHAPLKAMLPKSLRRRALGAVRNSVVFAEPRPADERLMQELRARYRPEVEAFGEYIGSDLISRWGYAGAAG